jgi:chemotaxis protein CheD
MSAIMLTAPTNTAVGMGHIALTSGQDVAHTVLGSCLGLALYEPRQRVGALAHIVLPAAQGRAGSPGKFADTAIEWMLAAMRRAGADPKRLTCKLTGGANMFAGNGPFQIGQQNIEAARQHLAAAKITVVAEHLGGKNGRRVVFECETGKVTVEVAGQAPVTL